MQTPRPKGRRKERRGRPEEPARASRRSLQQERARARAPSSPSVPLGAFLGTAGSRHRSCSNRGCGLIDGLNHLLDRQNRALKRGRRSPHQMAKQPLPPRPGPALCLAEEQPRLFLPPLLLPRWDLPQKSCLYPGTCGDSEIRRALSVAPCPGSPHASGCFVTAQRSRRWVRSDRALAAVGLPSGAACRSESPGKKHPWGPDLVVSLLVFCCCEENDRPSSSESETPTRDSGNDRVLSVSSACFYL